MAKKSFPLSKVYGLLEPGPVALVTTAEKGRPNIMTMSWHTMLEFEPPLIDECYASLECKLVDAKLVAKYCFFILEVVQAWIARSQKDPRTLHHRGRGAFMLAGETIKLPSKMK